MTIICTVQVAHIRAALLAAAKKDVRYYLKGISVEPDLSGATLVGTDGHRLHVVRVQTSEGNAASMEYAGLPVIIPRDACETICKGGKGIGEQWITISITDDGNTLALARADGMSISCAPVDGRFPEWRRLIPATDSEPKEASTLNVSYVADALQAAQGLGFRHQAPYIHHNGLNPALLAFAGVDNFAAIIMPVRADRVYPDAAFAWSPPQLAQTEAA